MRKHLIAPLLSAGAGLALVVGFGKAMLRALARLREDPRLAELPGQEVR